MNRAHILHFIATLFTGLLTLTTAAAQLRIVNTTDDTNDGVCNATHCSLREAIRAANQNPGPDTIVFNITGPGPHVIAPITSLPTITGAGTVIDGSTQPGYFPGAIVLVGNGSATPVDGLEIAGANCAIYGLHIRRFPSGIIVFGGSNARIGAAGKGNIIGGNTLGGITVMGNSPGMVIAGNLIGMFPNGTGADPNEHGIFLDGQLFGAVPNTTVGGANPGERNIISGNRSEGIFARGVSGLSVFGNIIGLNAAETAALPNGRNGVAVTNSSSCTIGNLAGGHNTISGNGINGINLTGIASGGARVQGNRIGADRSGQIARPNAGNGIFLSDAPGTFIHENILSSNVLSGLEAVQSGGLVIRQNLIGLLVSAGLTGGNGRDGISLSNCDNFVIEDNSISTNLQHGIWVQMLPDRASANGVISHNYIGNYSVVPSQPLGNARYGLALVNCANVIVDGLNVIASNGSGGVLISNSADIILEDNAIGTDQAGLFALGNGGPGITVNAMSEGILIGNLGAGNVIAHNQQGGVVVSENSTSCTISGNSIYCNQIAGIDLTAGANDDMMPPMEICVAPSRITGMAGPFDLIEVFRHNHADCSTAPSCQGRTFLAGTIAGVDGSWSVSGFFSIGDTITATATNLAGSTSEFSLCSIVRPLPQAVADNSGTACPGEEAQLIGTSIPADTGIAFEWSGPGGFTSDSARISGVLSPGEYMLTVQQGFCRSEPDTTTVTYYPQATGSFQTTLCPGASITVNGTVYNEMNLSGTEVLADAAANGCDSILSVQVNYYPQATGSFQTTLCPGASITVNGTIYNEMNRTGTEILTGAAANGCDSILSVQVNFYSPATGSFQTTLCPGASITVNGTIYNEMNRTGTEILTGAALNGCDSILSVQVNFYPLATGSFQTTLCPGASITVNGTIYNEMNRTGTEVLVGAAAHGCDSILSVQVNFYPLATGSFQITLCPGTSITINGTVYNEMNRTGTEILAGAAANGCDSILSVQVNFFPPATGSFQTTICPGESITVNGTVYSQSNPGGVELLPGASVNGCDSTFTVSISFFSPAGSTLRHGICPGESVIVNGVMYGPNRLSGTEILRGVSVNGCDSTVVIDLFVLPVPETTFEATICPGTEIVINGRVYGENKTTGTEVFRGAAANGCDSIVHVRLTIDSLILTIRLRAANCSPQERGQITFFSIEGGTAPYAVALDGASFAAINDFPYIINNLAAGPYQLTFRDHFGCLYREGVTIPDNPLFNISRDTVVEIRRGQTVQLGYGFSFVPDWIRWSPPAGLSCDDCTQPETTPLYSTTYEMDAEFFGCTARQTVRILVDTRVPVYAPTGFTPNGDAVNDRFTLFATPGDLTRIISLKVFNRWGGMMYDGKDLIPGDITSGWDGTFDGRDCPSGMYVFMAEVETAYGEVIALKGELSLVR